jgi:hypothetical protein
LDYLGLIAGCPRKGKDLKDTKARITIRISKKLKISLSKIADRERRSLNQQIEHILEKHINEENRLNQQQQNKQKL